jgi:hypothetical protein
MKIRYNSPVVLTYSNSKFESVRHLALNLARALARNNTASKSMIKSKSKSKKKAGRKDNTLLNLELLSNLCHPGIDLSCPACLKLSGNEHGIAFPASVF